MHAKTNRLNHDFQILYFLVGACYTPDGAYALLCDLREGREDALKQHQANVLRRSAQRLRAERKIQSRDEAERLEGEADIAELNGGNDTLTRCVNGAQAELAFINLCIERIQQFRRFKDLPDAEAHEKAQCDEWREELISRAENLLLSGGMIPADQLVVMRQHPEFESAIWPAIQQIKSKGTVAAPHRNLVKLLGFEDKEKLRIVK